MTWFIIDTVICSKFSIKQKLSKALNSSQLNNTIGLSMYRSILDFLKIFLLSSGNSLNSFSDNNTCAFSSGTFVLTKYTAENILLNFNSGKK